MYCYHCGKKNMQDSRFCSSCGKQVQAVEEKEEIVLYPDIAAPVEEDAMLAKRSSRNSSRAVRWLQLLIPVACLVLISAGLSYYYFHEKAINKEVLDLKTDAEDAAFVGEYDKSLSLLRKAINMRPDYSALQMNMDVIERAVGYEKDTDLISKKIKTADYAAASNELASLKEALNAENSPVFELFKQKAEKHGIQITVGTIKKELNELTTVEQLGGKLSILTTLPEKEASAVKKDILNKIVQISSDEVETYVTKKQFSDALSLIDKSLQFASDDEKLLSLKQRVTENKTAFEKAENERIEKAMEAAALEDLKNKTAAVSIHNFSVDIDEYGDLIISGSVENVATKSIYSITVEYSIYDDYNNYVRSGSTSVYPYYLNPGEWGYFEYTYYGVYEDVYNVEIDNIRWYIQ